MMEKFRWVRLVHKCLNLRQIMSLRGYIHPNEQLTRGIYATNALSFCCTLMILHLLRMHRYINRNVYNAGIMLSAAAVQDKLWQSKRLVDGLVVAVKRDGTAPRGHR